MWRPYFLDCFLPCGYRCDDDERVLPFFLLVFLFFFYLFLLFGRLRFHSRFLPLSGRRRRLLLRSQVGRRWLLLAVNHNALIPESYGRRGRSRQLFCVYLLDGAGSVSLYSIAFRLDIACPRRGRVCINSGWDGSTTYGNPSYGFFGCSHFWRGSNYKKGPTDIHQFTTTIRFSLGISCNCLLVFRVGPLSVKRKRGRSRTPNNNKNLTSITTTDG